MFGRFTLIYKYLVQCFHFVQREYVRVACCLVLIYNMAKCDVSELKLV